MNKKLDELEKEVEAWLDDINRGEAYKNVSLNWWFDEDASERYGPRYHFSIVVAQQTDSCGGIDVSLCEVGEDWVEVTPFDIINCNEFYLSGAGSYTYKELSEALCIDETDDDEYAEFKNFLFEEYCNRKGKEVQDITETEQVVLEWAAELMDEECLAVLNISHAPQEWDETTARVEYISFPIQFLYDDGFEGNIVHEVVLLGDKFFEYETREMGLTKEDIQGFIDAYREYENAHT